jgi:hypothetical protein
MPVVGLAACHRQTRKVLAITAEVLLLDTMLIETFALMPVMQS